MFNCLQYFGLPVKIYPVQDVGEENEAESDTKDITHTPNGKAQRIQWHYHVFLVISLSFNIIVTTISN